MFKHFLIYPHRTSLFSGCLPIFFQFSKRPESKRSLSPSLVFGYAYPAFECFKTLEKNKVDIEELRFWCQYWIIAAAITVFERVDDIFVAWIPMYGEAKLTLFIYLWYPKTKGCRCIYESIVRPYISAHETDIDRRLQELRARALDLAIYYWKNCTKLGQAKFFEILQYVVSQSANIAHPKSENNAENQVPTSPSPSPPPRSPPITPSSSFKKSTHQLSGNNRKLSKKLGRPPVPPPSPTGQRIVDQSPRTRTQVQDIMNNFDEDDNRNTLNDMVDQNGVDHNLQSPTLKLRRSKTPPPPKQ